MPKVPSTQDSSAQKTASAANAAKAAKPDYKGKKPAPLGVGSGVSSIAKAEGAKIRGKKRKATSAPVDAKLPPKKKARNVSTREATASAAPKRKPAASAASKTEAAAHEGPTERQILVIDNMMNLFCDLGERNYVSIVADVARSQLPMFAGGTLHTIINSEEFNEFANTGVKRPDFIVGRMLKEPLLSRIKGIYEAKGESLLGFKLLTDFLADAVRQPTFNRQKSRVFAAMTSAKPGLQTSTIARLFEENKFLELGNLLFKD
ncbi:MAG: hypothetical protein S4CHLAM37_05760 [Chlamydiia bacterium]|nr:hypothetical protein [Chlamydiia bacterium]